LRLGALERELHGVRLLEVGTVDEFHVSVDVESHLILVLFVELTWLEVDVVDAYVQLEPEGELSTSYAQS